MTSPQDRRSGVPYFLKPRWLAGHFGVFVITVLFLRLGWWQILSAVEGRVLSFGYALQWPLFAGFVVFLWIRTVRQHRGTDSPAPRHSTPAFTAPGPLQWTFDRTGPSIARSDPKPGAVTAFTVDDDQELRDYQDMLDWVRADPRRHPYQYRRLKGAEARRT